MTQVVLFDTTLRDGSQRAGISFSVHDKVRIAHRLDEFGVQYIEGGWPGSNPKDEEFFRAMRGETLRQARLVAFSSTRRGGVSCEADANLQVLLAAGTQAVCIFGKSWDFHVTAGLGVDLQEGVAMVGESVRFLKSRGKEVIYDAEHFFDGFKRNSAFCLATLAAAVAGGCDYLVLCDTNGGTMPLELSDIVAQVRQRFPEVRLGIHAHDDAGCGVANTVVAVQAGCEMVQGTINGYGERCGNANLVAVLPNLQLKLGLTCVPAENLPQLNALAHCVSELANLAPWDAQPYVGKNAFAHKAGVHVSAVLKAPAMYEHVNPERVGSERRVIVSELSGRANLVAMDRDGDLALGDASARDVVAMVKDLEYAGYQFEGAEASLEVLVRERQGEPAPFVVEGFRVVTEKREDDQVFSEATVKLTVGERRVHTAGEGNGPVNALDQALRRALATIFPDLAVVKLLDYKVRVLEGSDGTGAKVRVLIESGDGQDTWGTVGVSANIIEASWQALVHSLVYPLVKGRAAPSLQGLTAH